MDGVSSTTVCCRTGLEQTSSCLGREMVVRAVGILLGTRLWYGFYGQTLDDDDAFLSKARELMREIGNKGKLPDLDSQRQGDLSKSPSAVHDLNGAGTPVALDTAPDAEPGPEPKTADAK